MRTATKFRGRRITAVISRTASMLLVITGVASAAPGTSPPVPRGGAMRVYAVGSGHWHFTAPAAAAHATPA
ncbi:MAG TPA: hypothetical protein VH912_33440 [Streptosporangiaceae bacterium]